jgi:hypothetical protein
MLIRYLLQRVAFDGGKDDQMVFMFARANADERNEMVDRILPILNLELARLSPIERAPIIAIYSASSVEQQNTLIQAMKNTMPPPQQGGGGGGSCAIM